MDFEYANDCVNYVHKRTFYDLIQVGGCICDEDFTVLDSFCYYVKPHHLPLSEEITNLTGITNELVENADTIDTVTFKLSDIIDECDKIYAYGDKDIDSLKTNLKYFKEDANKELFNKMLNKIEPYFVTTEYGTISLVNLSQVFDLDNNTNHNALGDAIMLRNILYTMLKKYPKGHNQNKIEQYMRYTNDYRNLKILLGKFRNKGILDEVLGSALKGEKQLDYNAYMGLMKRDER